MKTFGRAEVLAFLGEIDELLDRPVAMEIIGGAAALLAYGARSATKDIDPRIFELQFLHIIERLFGPKQARRIGAKGRPKMKRRGSDKL